MTLEEFKKYQVKCESEEEAREVLGWIVEMGGRLSYGRTPESEAKCYSERACFVRDEADHDNGCWGKSSNFQLLTFSQWKEMVRPERKKTLYTLEQMKEKKIAINARTKEEDERIRKWAHEQGLKWGSGDSYKDRSEWGRTSFCHNLTRGTRGRLEFYEDEGYTIITVPEFFMEEAKPYDALAYYSGEDHGPIFPEDDWYQGALSDYMNSISANSTSNNITKKPMSKLQKLTNKVKRFFDSDAQLFFQVRFIDEDGDTTELYREVREEVIDELIKDKMLERAKELKTELQEADKKKK